MTRKGKKDTSPTIGRGKGGRPSPEGEKEGEKGKGGRPSSFRPEFVQQAKKLGMLGLTDAQLAQFFGVAESTLYKWKVDHPEFSEALKEAREVADSNVAVSLYRRAMGYSHPAVKIFWNARTNREKVISYTEHYPPDSTAMIFWLKNRQREHWRDKQDHEVAGPDGGPVQVKVTHRVIDPSAS